MPIRINFLFDALRTLGSLLVVGSMSFFYTIHAQAAQVSLAWNPSSSPNVAGYLLYYGQASHNYNTPGKDVGNQTSGTLDSLQTGTTYYFAITAYTYDSTGKKIESAYSNEVSTTIGNPSSTCHPCSIWAASVAPGVGADPDTAAVELGVKFKADVNGHINGIRFYKSTANTGTHTGTLWSSNGTRLATATFTGETASGWQQVNFATPVAITANTIYMASYHTNVGHYNGEEYYFSGKGVDNPPLHALADGGVAGANSVYAYGASSSFPNQSWRSSNYWVDVIFTTP